MGDGPTTGTGDSGTVYRRPGEMPWPEDPQTVSGRVKIGPNGEYRGANNPLDARHDPVFPGESAQGIQMGRDQRYLTIPGVQYSPGNSAKVDDPEAITPPGSHGRVRYIEDQPLSTPSTLRGEFPTREQVHAETGKFWNNNVDIAQLAWHGYKLFPQGPWPSLPQMFPVLDHLNPNAASLHMCRQNLHANLKNLTNKQTVEPFGKKMLPLGIAGGAFVAEVGIDAVLHLDKNEFQTGRIIADFFGPALVMSSSPMLNTWWKKALFLVGTHTAGRYADKFTETPMKKWNMPPDE